MKKMKKLLVSLLALLLVVTMLPISAVAAQDDTQVTPTATPAPDSGWIAIDDAEEFLKIGVDEAYPSTGSYYLTDDIDFANRTDPENPVPREFTSYLLAKFDGTLDGCGFSISGFAIAATGNAGMIQSLGSTANSTTICNLTIGTATEPVTVTLNIASGNMQAGILAGAVGGTNTFTFIDNVHIYGEISAANASTGILRLGAFGGYCSSDMTVQNSSFTGEISANGDQPGTRYAIGGILGATDCYANRGRQVVIKGCEVDADLTYSFISGAYNGNPPFAIGGLIGFNQISSTFVEDCTVTGNFTSKKFTGTDTTEGGTAIGVVGGIIGNVYAAQEVKTGYSNSILLVANNCTSTATLTGATTNDVYNVVKKPADTLEQRIYVTGCTSQNTLARDFGDFGEVDGNAFDANYDYVWLIDEKADLAKIGKADATNTSYTYAIDGFYRLENDLSLGAMTTYAVSGHFGGVFDGNGKSVTMTTATYPFFQRLADGYSASNNANDVVILDLDLGTPDSYIQMTSSAALGGVLAAYCGDNTINYRVLVSNVNVYANITNKAASASAVGGLIGTSRFGSYYDCNMYGSITSQGITKTGATTYIGGFVGSADKAVNKNIFSGCNNFADIDVNESAPLSATSSVVNVGGFIGDSASGTYLTAFLNSNNFGDLTVESEDFTQKNVGGLAGSVSATSIAAVTGCANFGKISSAQNASGVVANTNAALSLSNFLQVGTVSADTKAEDYANAAGTATVSTLGCKKVSNPVAMENGASVRLAEDTGLRFTATVSADVIAKLSAIAGEEVTVTYGMLIAPDAFIGNGEFTHEALDAYASEHFNVEAGEKAYIDVPSVEDGENVWFKDQAGKLAGSITGIPATLYGTDFSGVAYVTVMAGESCVFTVYASNAQSRNVYAVAKAALDDTTDEIATVDGYTYDQAIEVGETYYLDGEAKVFAEGDAAVYSCYPKNQRDTLNQIVSDADSIVTE